MWVHIHIRSSLGNIAAEQALIILVERFISNPFNFRTQLPTRQSFHFGPSFLCRLRKTLNTTSVLLKTRFNFRIGCFGLAVIIICLNPVPEQFIAQLTNAHTGRQNYCRRTRSSLRRAERHPFPCIPAYLPMPFPWMQWRKSTIRIL